MLGTLSPALRRALLLLCALILADHTALGQGDANSSMVVALKPEVQTLPNGVRVIVLPDHSTPLVALEAWLRCGSADEQPGEEGAAHMLEHMLFKGTASRKPGQADLEIENLGSTLSASTSRDWMRINTVVASRFVKDAVQVLADMVAAPSLSASELETEKRVVLDEISQSSADSLTRIRDRVAARAYGTHPYGRPIPADPDSVKRLTREKLARFADRALVPSNIAVVIVGDISPETAFSLASKHFSSLRAKSRPTPRATQTEAWRPRGPSDPERISIDGGLAWYAVAFPAPAVTQQADVLAVDVIHSILDQGPGGRLSKALLATRIAKRLEVEYTTRRHEGMLFIALGAEPHRLSEARDRLWDELDAIRSIPVSPEELASAYRRLLAEYAFATETVSGKAFAIGFYEVLGDYTIALNYPSMVARITRDQVMSAAKRYIDIKRAVSVIAYPGGPP